MTRAPQLFKGVSTNRLLSWALAAVSISIGLSFLTHPPSSSTGVLTVVDRIGNNAGWGFAFAVLGVTLVSVLLTNHRWYPHVIHALMAGLYAMYAAALWSAVTITVVDGHPGVASWVSASQSVILALLHAVLASPRRWQE